MLAQSKLDRISADLQKIRMHFGPRVHRVAVFGSVLRKPFSRAHDIDVALFLRDTSLLEARNALLSLKLSFPLEATAINGKYEKAAGPRMTQQKHYHVVVLNAFEPNPEFMDRNRDGLCYLA